MRIIVEKYRDDARRLLRHIAALSLPTPMGKHIEDVYPDEAVAVAVEVKPLEWVQEVDAPCQRWSAVSACGRYEVGKSLLDHDWYWWSPGNMEHPREATEARAKAAAQADYDARIRSALVNPAPSALSAARQQGVLEGLERQGWNTDMPAMPWAVTLLFLDQMDSDGMETVRLGLRDEAGNAAAWAMLPAGSGKVVARAMISSRPKP